LCRNLGFRGRGEFAADAEADVSVAMRAIGDESAHGREQSDGEHAPKRRRHGEHL